MGKIIPQKTMRSIIYLAALLFLLSYFDAITISELSLGMRWTALPPDKSELVSALGYFPSPFHYNFYSTRTIALVVQNMTLAPSRLVVYDPADNVFRLYSIGSKQEPQMMSRAFVCGRCAHILPLLIDALWNVRPHRFQPHQRPFQLVFSDADFFYSNCTRSSVNVLCPTNEYAPYLQFGSVLKDRAIFPSCHAFPNSFYLPCILEWRRNTTISQCSKWRPPFQPDLIYENLVPQVIWRGSDYSFLETLHPDYFASRRETLSPRQRAVDMSEIMAAHNNGTSWIDAAFFPSPRPGEEFVSPDKMARWRYQIDLGGAGGTTWKGTLDKLAMPGLLLHHETPAQDWFYDELVAWRDYVPVRSDLSDLKEKFEWAEEHPVEAAKISSAGTKFVRDFFSGKRLQKEYEKFFGTDSLGSLVDYYQPGRNESVPSVLGFYEDQGLMHTLVATCNRTSCRQRFPRGEQHIVFPEHSLWHEPEHQN